jgi:hypothetical protein
METQMTPQSIALAVVMGPLAFYVCLDVVLYFMHVVGGKPRRDRR